MGPVVTAESNPQVWRKYLTPISLVGLLFVAAVLGVYGGRYLDRKRLDTPQMKIQQAIEDFRSGDDGAALSLFKPLADGGNPMAQYWLAHIYENGLGVKSDIAIAMGLLEKSAAQSFLPAERQLGELYLQGNETLQDFGKAESWLNKAAIAGDSSAQRQLGHIFALGLGVAPDLAQAYGWYENASLNGDGLAKRLRDDIITRMSPAEIAAGEQSAKAIAASIKPVKP